LAGCQDGPDGVKRLRSTAAEIMKSDEVKRLTTEAMTFAEVLVRRAASSRSLGNLSGSVTDVLMHRASAIGKGSRAA
jgi:hypothetical protein